MRNIILFDKQDITCIGIESLLKQISGVGEIVAVEDKPSLVSNLSKYPDSIVILDYTLSDFTSIDELLNVGYKYPKTHWLLFSEELSSTFLRQLFVNSESYSIVLKSSLLGEINMALIHTLKSERYICSRVMNQLLSAQKNMPERHDTILTTTEKEILKEIALGRTTKEIAVNRNLSFHTVITHRKNIFRKLEVNNVHEAIKYAIRAGIVDMAEYYI